MADAQTDIDHRTEDSTGAPQTSEAVPADDSPPHRRKRNPLLIVLLLLVIAGAAGAIVWEVWPLPPDPLPTKAYYTTDDGKTLFVDDAEQLPPFDHDGKPAVRAMVYSCDGGKTRFVGYLQKLPEDALREEIRKTIAAGGDPKSIDDDDIARKSGWLAKRPGDAKWVNSKDHDKYVAVVKVACPDGRAVLPEMVHPPEKK